MPHRPNVAIGQSPVPSMMESSSQSKTSAGSNLPLRLPSTKKDLRDLKRPLLCQSQTYFNPHNIYKQTEDGSIEVSKAMFHLC